MANRSITLNEEFKKAISNMPNKEKDKLLFKLLKKEETLVDKLQFELVENKETLPERREKIEKYINSALLDPYCNTPKEIAKWFRVFVMHINNHVKATKDIYGEIHLSLYMLNLSFQLHKFDINNARIGLVIAFNEFVAKRSLKILQLLPKIHKDYHIDFKENLQELGEHIQSAKRTKEMAEKFDLDIEILLNGEIPD